MPPRLNSDAYLLRRLSVVVLLWSCVQQGQAAETVQALRYGTTLFEFYQQDYFNALTELGAAQELEQLGMHQLDAELLRGGMSLSYGMDLEAERIFETFLAESGDAIDKNQAWFYLGKMAWQRGDAERARRALGQLSIYYDGVLADESNFLQASIGLSLDEAEAARYLDSLPEDSKWRYYLYYNLGAERAVQGDWINTISYLNQFDALEIDTPEMKALQDKAKTASGFAHLAIEDFVAARDDFSQVRLTSPLSDRALLGYGWSALELGDYGAALSPWQVLSERSMLGASARESLLAVPYAYEQLGKPGVAMERYRLASVSYTDELTTLRDAIDAFAVEDLRSLLSIGGEQAGDWFFAASILPENEFAPYLQHLVSGHEFQVAVRELRDLYSIAGHLQHANERLQVLSEVDSHQQDIWGTVLEGKQRDELAQRQHSLVTTIEDVRRRLDDAVADKNGRSLADATEQARWARLERAEKLAAQLGSKAEQQQNMTIMHGLLLFEDSENYSGRVWRLERQVRELEALAQQSELALQQVDTAIAQREMSDFSSRIVGLEQRVAQQTMGVDLAIAVSETGVRQLAVVELKLQEQQLASALGRSSLAIARLYDQGSLEVSR